MIKCQCCNQEKNEKQINDVWLSEFNGFSHHSYSINVCGDCFKKDIKYTEKGVFVKLNGKLYFKDYVPFANYERIFHELQIDRIFNKDYYDAIAMFHSTLERV